MKADCEEEKDVDSRRRRSVDEHYAVVSHQRSRRAAETDGGSYTVTSRFEVHDDSHDDPHARGTSVHAILISSHLISSECY